MSYHVIDISTANVSLSVKDGQLFCKEFDGAAKKLPMEDIGAILINSFSANFHGSFLLEAAKRKIAVIVCERFRPTALVLPVQRASDTILTRAQIQAPRRFLKTMWLATIDSKCANQYEFASRICPEREKELADFRISLKSGSAAKEGNCARIYWGLFSQALGAPEFRRSPQGDGLNSLLNYGYAVLMLRIEQKLLACGLDPLYGMGHVTRERSLPLAYDMMEPFRPAVDEMVYEWIREHRGEQDALAVERPYKSWIQGLMQRKYPFRKSSAVPLDRIADAAIRSYRAALQSGTVRDYEPWIRRSSKWGG